MAFAANGAEKKTKAKKEPAESPKEVEVFQFGVLPDRTFKELETFTDDITRREEPEITRKFVKKAQGLGADALIVFPLERSGSELVPFQGFRDTFAYRAAAVRFTGPPGSAPRPVFVPSAPAEQPVVPSAPATASPPKARQLAGSGTGFFITRDGYLITNDHVVKGASELKVLVGRALLPATVVKNDPANDLALLKVEGRFEPLAIAPSRAVKLGDPVLTIGFPRPDTQGMEPKLSRGDISGTSGLHDNPNEFQISNPVQPGNSGGALVNSGGDVVGVVVAVLSHRVTLRDGGALPQNVNFAVKSTYVTALLESVSDIKESDLGKPTGQEKSSREIIDQTLAATVQVLSYR